MLLTQTILNTAEYLKNNLENIRDQAFSIETRKKQLIDFKTPSQALALATFIREEELPFYNNITQMLYIFQSKYFGLLEALQSNDSEKYAALKTITDEFPALEKNCAAIQLYVFDQMHALEDIAKGITNNGSQKKFKDAYFSQLQISYQIESHFEKKAKALPQVKRSVIPWRNANIQAISRFRGFAKAVAMMLLATTMFVQTLLPASAPRIELRAPPQRAPIVQTAAPITFQIPKAQPPKAAVVPKNDLNIDECIDFIKYWEGFRSHVYTDSLGYLTVGYGTCIDTRVRKDAKAFITRFGINYEGLITKKIRISQTTAQQLMLPEVQLALTYAPKAVANFAKLPKEAKYIVVDMIYNLGINKFLKFKNAIAALNQMDFETAAKELKNSKWYEQTARRAQHHVADMQALGQQYKIAA
ncbi:MAG TPA: hypothetical protein VK158_01510 [Acidobacteriota bacterium]|nr:hypothetical protein [Acidobacteriota bacterium]